jgi:LmbE family N-acetylglucosaminyl deacetylase
LAAFHAAADAARYPEQGTAWQVSRLFYTAIPRSFFLDLRDRLDALGEDTSQFERFEEAGAGWPDDQVDVTLDVEDRIEVKWTALNCHRTQFGPDNLFRRLPENMLRRILGREYFALAWPHRGPGLQLADLFAGM